MTLGKLSAKDRSVDRMTQLAQETVRACKRAKSGRSKGAKKKCETLRSKLRKAEVAFDHKMRGTEFHGIRRKPARKTRRK